jgi:hypothetical protein
MSSDLDKQASASESQQAARNPEKRRWSEAETESILRTRVDSGSVVDFIENMVDAIGSTAAGQIPQRPARRPQPSVRKYQSKSVTAIMQKLARVEKYPDLAAEFGQDRLVLEWLEHTACKQKEYYDELECAQQLTGFFGGRRQFDLALKAASKAVSITLLHRREDTEALAELHWVHAELHAAADDMEQARACMLKCLALIEPGAGESDPTYRELLLQLEETRERCRMVTPS